jgi:hypothetical protein
MIKTTTICFLILGVLLTGAVPAMAQNPPQQPATTTQPPATSPDQPPATQPDQPPATGQPPAAPPDQPPPDQPAPPPTPTAPPPPPPQPPPTTRQQPTAARPPDAPINKNAFVDVNFGFQPSSRSLSIEANPIVYEEAAIIRSSEDIKSTALIDVMGGYRVWRDLSVVLGLTTTFSTSGDATVVGAIPHPAVFDRRVESTKTVSDLKHSERSVHISAMWTTPISDKMDGSIFAGPTYVKVKQELVTSVDVPVNTQTFTPSASEETASVWGFHFGGDVTYLVTPMVGVGGMVRFVRAKADLPSVADVTVAGFQVGGGLRLRF